MLFGLLKNGGCSEISENDVSILHLERDYSINWIYYYYIEINRIEDLQVLIDFYGKITIDIDPTTNCLLVIGFSSEENNKDNEVPF